MKRSITLMLAGAALAASAIAQAQVAGSERLGVAEAEIRDVKLGWSAKRQVLGQPVFNDQNEQIGAVEDVIIDPEREISYAIVGVGGFLGLGEREVAIPSGQLRPTDDGFLLPGATKDALRAMPEFEYAEEP